MQNGCIDRPELRRLDQRNSDASQGTFSETESKKEKKGCFAEFSCGETLPAADAGTKPDAYVLRVTENAIRIDAASESGLFYGIQTFLQLPARSPVLKSGTMPPFRCA